MKTHMSTRFTDHFTRLTLSSPLSEKAMKFHNSFFGWMGIFSLLLAYLSYFSCNFGKINGPGGRVSIKWAKECWRSKDLLIFIFMCLENRIFRIRNSSYQYSKVALYDKNIVLMDVILMGKSTQYHG